MRAFHQNTLESSQTIRISGSAILSRCTSLSLNSLALMLALWLRTALEEVAKDMAQGWRKQAGKYHLQKEFEP